MIGALENKYIFEISMARGGFRNLGYLEGRQNPYGEVICKK